VGLFFALMIQHCGKMSFLFRTLTILPIAIPEVVLVLVWRLMLHPQYGVLNYMLYRIGLLPADFSWFSSGRNAVAALLMISVWKVYPLAFLMLFAGLKGIPGTLYEAAAIDGAGPVRRFWTITMPGLKYVTSSLLLLIAIWQIRSFTIIWLSTKGGPADATATLPIFSYLNAFNFNKLGYGSAIGFLVVLICLAVAFIYYQFVIRKLGDE
jgi:ABC-type sugar transport system permease subunit